MHMSTIESALTHEQSHSKPAQAWTVTIIAAMFMLYEFIQMNMFSSINADLMQTFQLGSKQLGHLSSRYFLANLLFLLPAAQLLDRFSPRRLILITLTLCIAGTILFALANSFSMAVMCRFVTGIGSAFCLLGAIRIASRWFPTEKMALVSGVIITMAMLGGLIAQSPVATLVSWVGWRQTLLIDAAFGTIILLAIATIVKDTPKNYQPNKNETETRNFWCDLKIAYLRIQNWAGGIYTCLLNLPIFILGALYGSLFLHQIHHFTRQEASNIILLLYVGAMVGSPVAGWLSDKLNKRLLPMRISAVLSLSSLLAIMYLPTLSAFNYLILFFALGFFTSSQIISYPLINESNPSRVTAAATSVISMCCIGSGYLFQPLVGNLIERHWNNQISEGIAQYSYHDYMNGFIIMPIAFVVALFITFFLKETNCRRQ